MATPVLNLSSTLDPFSTTKSTENAPVAMGSGMGFFENETFSSSAPSEKPKPIVNTIFFNAPLGSATEALGGTAIQTLKSAGSLAGDFLSEGFDILKIVTGVGVETTAAENYSQVTSEGQEHQQQQTTENSNDEANTQFKLQVIRNNIKQLGEGQTIERQSQQMNEVFRLLEGQKLTKEQSRERGHLDETAKSTLIDVAREQAEVKNQVEEQETQQQTNGIDRIVGADQNRNFEDQNMTSPG